MSGLKATATSAVTDTSTVFPTLRDDARLISPGSLVLHDLNHSATTGAAIDPLALTTVPTSGLALPNLAYKECAATIGGSPSQHLLASTLSIDGSPATSELVMERSGKGGIHGIVSQTNNTTANHGAAIRAAALIEAYMYANQGHQFYWSLWSSFTRLTSGSTSAQAELSDGASIGAKYLARFAQTTAANVAQTSGAPATASGGRLTATTPALGPIFRNVGESGYNGSTASTFFRLLPGLWGKDQFFNGQYSNVHASWILYGFYVEDLTASGRTYAQVDAIDYALYQSAFATGGKYNADTFTTPAN